MKGHLTSLKLSYLFVCVITKRIALENLECTKEYEIGVQSLCSQTPK